MDLNKILVEIRSQDEKLGRISEQGILKIYI